MEKAEVEYRFPSIKDTTLATKFAELVGEGLQQCKKAGLAYLQDKTDVEGITGFRNIASMTKKETVMLLNSVVTKIQLT